MSSSPSIPHVLPEHPVFALFTVADRSPDTGDGGTWHQRNEYALRLSSDHAECVRVGDWPGATECVLDAIDTLIEWNADEAPAVAEVHHLHGGRRDGIMLTSTTVVLRPGQPTDILEGLALLIAAHEKDLADATPGTEWHALKTKRVEDARELKLSMHLQAYGAPLRSVAS